MPRLGFELTILVFERAKIFHSLDRAVTVIVMSIITMSKKLQQKLEKKKLILFHLLCLTIRVINTISLILIY
jgi:hypothetical protein